MRGGIATRRGFLMPTIHLRLTNGRGADFSVAAAGDPADTSFVLGVRKCGSSIMNSLVMALAKLNHRPFLDIGGRFFQADVPENDWRGDPAVLALLVPGQVHGGFRGMAPVLTQSPLWAGARKILLVRDPRDALVSEYYSVAYSHAVPAASHGDGARTELLAARAAALASAIEDFVLSRAAAINRTFVGYAEASRDPLTLVFRYEDVILDKRPWVAAMAAHFGWNGGSADFVEKMMGWADKVPTKENPRAFVRKVVPGDHQEKLRKGVIRRLNRKLAPAMELFGYR
jgi:hypothetical protein